MIKDLQIKWDLVDYTTSRIFTRALCLFYVRLDCLRVKKCSAGLELTEIEK